MTDREKLIALLDAAHDEYYKHFDMSRGYMATLADHLIANGVTFATDTNVGSKWIIVEDGLPESRGEVLVCTKNKQYGTRNIAKARFYSGSWHGSGGRWTNVTHWMPLPEPPHSTTTQKGDL